MVDVFANDAAITLTATVAGQVDWDTDFLVYEEDTVQAFKIPLAGGANVPLTLTTDFTLTGLGVSTGFRLSLSAAQAATIVVGDQITIYRDTPIERLTDFQTAGDYRAETVNREEDTEFMIMQELDRDLDRSIKVGFGEIGPGLTKGNDGETLTFDANGNIIPGPSSTDIQNAQASANAAATSASEAAASAVSAANSAAIAASNVRGTVADISSDITTPDPEHYMTAFYDTNQVNGSGALYKKVASEPSHVGKVQNGNGTWYELCVPFVTPQMFGARADDTTNDASAFINAQSAALALGVSVVVPNGNYLIDTTVSILGAAQWFMHGPTLRTSLDTATIFSADNKDDWSICGSCLLLGSLTVAVETSQYGLLINSGSRYKVSGVTASKFKGKGFYIYGSVAGTFRGDRGQFDNCAAYECTIGRQIDAGSGAEYTTWSNWNASGNVNADVIGAGNTVTSGGVIVDNTSGVKLVNGSNHGHGIYSGVEINHNTTNVEAKDVVNGFSFVGCHLYDGALLFDNCDGITFTGGIMDLATITVTDGAGMNAQAVRIQNVWWPAGYTPRTIGGTGVHKLIIQGCNGPGVPSRNLLSSIEAHAYINKGVSIGVTSATPTVVVFGSEVNDFAAAYNTSTGEFTVPDEGVYEISWNVIANGTAMDNTQSYMSLQSDDGLGGAFVDDLLSLPAIFSTTKLVFEGSGSIRYIKGQKIRLSAYIVGTSPSIGDSSWFCLLNIKKLGS